MQALILAAGMGKRLKDLTRNNTKCMVKVNGITLIERMLNQLEMHFFNKIIIVIGYEGKKLKEYVSSLKIKTPIEFVVNPIFDRTNNIYSLSLASDLLIEDDTILLESDLIFEDSVLLGLIEDPRRNLALVDKYESWMDGTCVLLSENDSIESFVPGKKLDFSKTKEYFKTVNIYKFSKEFSKNYYCPFLTAYQKALGENEYYEQVLRVITMLDNSPIKAKRLEGQKWYEIDDIQDLDIAESIFTVNIDEKASKMLNRNGGYWRYPKLLDFCNFSNSYFPSTRIINEIKANFDNLITQCPSGMQVNCLLASKNFNVDIDSIVVSGDLYYFINGLLGRTRKKSINIGIISNDLEQYQNYFCNDNINVFGPCSLNNYIANDVISYFDNKKIDYLLLNNPDNYLGNYISKIEVKKIVSWTKQKSIKMIIDESFVDFADDDNPSLIDKCYLKDNPHITIIKSISKSYGVPGLHLCILVSYSKDIIAGIKSSLPICSLNSFAEFFMQIFEKYKSDYNNSLELLKNERIRFLHKLSKFDHLKVIPSKACYFLIQFDKEIDCKIISNLLLEKFSILTKCYSSSLTNENFLKVAIKNQVDNDKFIFALRALLNEF